MHQNSVPPNILHNPSKPRRMWEELAPTLLSLQCNTKQMAVNLFSLSH